jgi:hypothetical protein
VTSPLPAQIQSTPGAPSSVRIGTVVSVNPVVVSLQGTVLNDVGFLGSYVPAAGDSVVLLGQSSSVSTDPTSWLVVGSSNQVSPAAYQAGEELISFVALSSFATPVVFAQPFAAPPAVVANINAASGTANLWFTRCHSISTTGFTLLVSAAAANTWTNISVQWQAQQMTQ